MCGAWPIRVVGLKEAYMVTKGYCPGCFRTVAGEAPDRCSSPDGTVGHMTCMMKTRKKEVIARVQAFLDASGNAIAAKRFSRLATTVHSSHRDLVQVIADVLADDGSRGAKKRAMFRASIGEFFLATIPLRADKFVIGRLAKKAGLTEVTLEAVD